MVVEDINDKPVKTLEVTATGHKYMNTSSKKERSGIPNTNGYREPSTQQASTPILQNFQQKVKNTLVKLIKMFIIWTIIATKQRKTMILHRQTNKVMKHCQTKVTR